MGGARVPRAVVRLVRAPSIPLCPPITKRFDATAVVVLYLPLRCGRYGAAGALSNNVNELSKFIIYVVYIGRI
jgi:hypothetical protein